MPAATPETSLPTPAPFAYTTEAELTESLQGKGIPTPPPGLYPRDGTEEVTAVETALSEFTIPDQRLNVVLPSGMAAMSGAVRFSLSLRGSELDRSPTFGYARDMYPQSKKSAEHLRRMGVNGLPFDSGLSMRSIDFGFGRGVPDVVCGESVSNTPNAAVLNIQQLLARTRRIRESGSDSNPIVVADNTLLLKTGFDFEEILTPEDRWLIVESATKGMLHNSGHLGVVYSKNEKLMDEFRKFKITEGLVTSTHSEGPMLEAFEATAPGFHDRNKALYASTATIALKLAQAHEELGESADFVIQHPNLTEHPNKPYADRVLRNGVTPVTFLETVDFDPVASQRLLKRIAEHPAITEQIAEGQVYLGQSFGFPEARLLYDPNACQVRIAGGHNIDSEALGEALYTAAVDI